MSQSKRPTSRTASAVAATGVLIALAMGASASAQSGVVIGSDEDLLHLLDSSGNVAVDFDVDDFGSTQQIVVGRADVDGGNQMNIDLRMIDAFSTLSDDDVSLFLDSSDASLRLGSGSAAEPGRDGDLFIEDGFGNTTFQIEGDDGNVTQSVDNAGSVTDFDGNGAVKGWAIIDFAGNVKRCYRCSVDPTVTQRLSTGNYEVGFLLNAISNRPVLATRACAQAGNPFDPMMQCTLVGGSISVSPRLNDDASFHVSIDDSAGDPSNSDFTLVVF